MFSYLNKMIKINSQKFSKVVKNILKIDVNENDPRKYHLSVKES